MFVAEQRDEARDNAPQILAHERVAPIGTPTASMWVWAQMPPADVTLTSARCGSQTMKISEVRVHQQLSDENSGELSERTALDNSQSHADEDRNRAILILRLSIGIVYLWFGALKFKIGASPAEALAMKTMAKLTASMLDPAVALNVLAAWECGVGLAFLSGFALRWAVALLLLHMIGPLLTLFLFPASMFTHVPYAPTMEGQYVIKNLILITGAIVVGVFETSRRSPASAEQRGVRTALSKPR
jgi:uncharacterized membrane protein YphA (DoxX/SURF4 family)